MEDKHVSLTELGKSTFNVKGFPGKLFYDFPEEGSFVVFAINADSFE